MKKTKIEMASADEAQPTLTPKLRFPEFRRAGGWDIHNGDKLFDQINNRQASDGLPVLAITQEFGAIPRDLIDYHVSVTDKSIETYKEVLPGDFIISLRSFQGGIEYSDYHGICSPAYVILRNNRPVAIQFYKQLFKSYSFIQQLTKNLEGLRDGKMVSYKQFSDLQLPYPSEGEQQKIADCLSSLDERIEAENQKLEALKTHKKGLMQQLFSREGESVPRLRFPEFRDAGEWEEIELGKVSKFFSGGTPPMAHAPFWNGTIPWISASSMHTTRIQYSTQCVTKEAIGNGTRIAPKGSLLILVRGSMLFKRVPIGIAEVDVAFNQDVKALSIDKRVKNIFLLYQLLAFESSIPIDKTGIGAGKIETSALGQFKLRIPHSAEQHRIAECLSSLDDLITAQADHLASLKTHKQGLMQQLFPAPETSAA
jgi:type I restriction enzyme S subunit